MYGSVLTTSDPERNAAELKRRSDIRAERRAALIATHGSVEAVTMPTQYEGMIIHQAGQYLETDSSDAVTIQGHKLSLLSSVMIYWPTTFEDKVKEALALYERDNDLCAVLDIDPDDKRTALHPLVALRRQILLKALSYENQWPYGFGSDPAPAWWPYNVPDRDID